MLEQSCSCCNGIVHRGVNRRRLMAGFGAAGLMAAAMPAFAADPVAKTNMTPDQALATMKEGNEKFATEAPFRVEQGRERRVQLARGQAPFCVLVGCSDSRVPPELLFGRGLGELFIVRNAGNTVDTAALGSIEYGVGVLGCPLIVVLGHQSCGAVAAAVDVVQKNATFPGVIGEMIQPIIPAVLAVRNQPGDLLDNAVRANAQRVSSRLKTQSALLQDAMDAKRVRIVAARYDLDRGHVDWYDAA